MVAEPWLREALCIWLPLAGFAGVIFFLAALPQGGALGIGVRLIASSTAMLALIDLALICFLFRDWGDAPPQLDQPRRNKEVLGNMLVSVVFWIGPIGMGVLLVLAAALFACAALSECRDARSYIRWLRSRRAQSPSGGS